MPTSSSTRSACTRLMSALVRVASAWLSFDLAATATFARSPEFWLVHRAWPLCQNSCAGQPRRRPASSRQRCARPTLQPHACAPRLRSGLVRLRCACFLLVVGRLVAFGFHVSIGLLPCLIRSCVELGRATERIATFGERVATLLKPQVAQCVAHGCVQQSQ